ncbi:hypothetical protein JCM5350_006057 [Sporobolomyces pararoseus]
MPSIPPAHFSPPHHDLSTLPAHLFQPLSMSLPAVRDSSETLVNPTPQNTISLDPLNSSASSVPSPSMRYSFNVDGARRDLTLCEESSGTPVLTARVATDEVKDKKSETSEVWVVFDGKSQIARLTEQSLYTKDGGEVKWSRFYKTSWLSRRRSWMGAEGKQLSWEEPARNAKPCELKLCDVVTKAVVAAVRLGTIGEPKYLTVVDDSLASLRLIFITFLHRMLEQAVAKRYDERRNHQAEEENEMLAW